MHPFPSPRKSFQEYKGRRLNQIDSPDFVCCNKIIVELKTVAKLVDEHRARVRNYLTVTGLELGLLVSFGHWPCLESVRIVQWRCT